VCRDSSAAEGNKRDVDVIRAMTTPQSPCHPRLLLLLLLLLRYAAALASVEVLVVRQGHR